jgi:hypothetical protein
MINDAEQWWRCHGEPPHEFEQGEHGQLISSDKSTPQD